MGHIIASFDFARMFYTKLGISPMTNDLEVAVDLHKTEAPWTEKKIGWTLGPFHVP